MHIIQFLTVFAFSWTFGEIFVFLSLFILIGILFSWFGIKLLIAEYLEAESFLEWLVPKW